MTGAPTERNDVHSTIDRAQLVVAGHRHMSRGATAAHWTMIVASGGLWLPFYWLHKATTRRVRF